MAYFGLQYHGDAPSAAARSLAEIAARLAGADGPSHWDRAHYVDQAGFSNIVSVAYWDDIGASTPGLRLRARPGPARVARRALAASSRCCGPASRGYETLFSSLGRPEGVAVIAEGMSGEVQEHAYWGGMRDRIPLSQTDEMAPGGKPALVRDGSRLRVIAARQYLPDPLRSGLERYRGVRAQDLSRRCRAGAAGRHGFPARRGLAIGCYANRYMRVLARRHGRREKSYGQSWWQSLAALERWAESHPTHVRIFGAAMKYLSTLGPVGEATALSRGDGGGGG